MKASFDKTYCVSKKCKNKCWRYESKWEFEKEGYYWFMETCKKEEEQ